MSGCARSFGLGPKMTEPFGEARTESVARLVSTTIYGGAKRRLISGEAVSSFSY